MNRRTGRTFRMLLGALYAASDGHKVRILMYGHDYARETAEKAWKMCEHNATRPGPFTIEFESGGRIVFDNQRTYSPRNALQGESMMWDHYRGEP